MHICMYKITYKQLIKIFDIANLQKYRIESKIKKFPSIKNSPIGFSVSEFNQTPSEIAQEKLEEEYKDLIGLPWVGRRYPGCYRIIQQYVQSRLGRSLKDFGGVYTSFTDEAVAEEDGLWISKPEWGEDWDMSILQKSDLLLFKIYTEALGGGYADKSGRSPNHGAIYLGDGWMLHQLWQQDSEIVKLDEHYRKVCVGIVRENAT